MTKLTHIISSLNIGVKTVSKGKLTCSGPENLDCSQINMDKYYRQDYKVRTWTLKKKTGTCKHL